MITQFKSLSPDYSVAELLAIKIKQEGIDLKGREFDCYFNCVFNWKYITLGIYPDGTVYTMYSDTGFSSLAKVYGLPKTLAEPAVTFKEDEDPHAWRGK